MRSARALPTAREGAGAPRSTAGAQPRGANFLKVKNSESQSPIPDGLDRRGFLKTAGVAAGLNRLAVETFAARPSSAAPGGLTDVNIHLSRWPLRRLPSDEPQELVATLRRAGVTEAWVGSFDGLFHKDLASVNSRLAEECRKFGRGWLRPFGSINPTLPDWEEDLRRCAEEHQMPGIRLHPNYHGYKLADPVCARLFQLATERRLIVQLAALMEDERMMHPLLRVAPVDLGPLPKLVRQTPSLRLVLLNALGTLRAKPLVDLLATGHVYVEIAMLESVGGVANLLDQIPPERVLFGSHAPLFYFESALLKLQESPLSRDHLRALRTANAQRLRGEMRTG